MVWALRCFACCFHTFTKAQSSSAGPKLDSSQSMGQRKEVGGGRSPSFRLRAQVGHILWSPSLDGSAGTWPYPAAKEAGLCVIPWVPGCSSPSRGGEAGPCVHPLGAWLTILLPGQVGRLDCAGWLEGSIMQAVCIKSAPPDVCLDLRR